MVKIKLVGISSFPKYKHSKIKVLRNMYKIKKDYHIRIYGLNPMTTLKQMVRKNIKNKLLCNILIEGLKE